MHYRLEYTEKARQDIDSLDHSVRQRIISKLDYFLTLPNPLVVAKRLSGVIDATFRFRVGDYRILFDIDSEGMVTVLMILHIKHRREVYD